MTRKLVLLTLLITSWAISLPSYAAKFTPPFTFTANTTALSGQMNTSMTNIATAVNNIDNTQIITGAAISPAKLDATIAYPLLLIAAATNAFSTGNTGDTVGRWAVTSDGKHLFGPGGSTAADTVFKRSAVGTLAVRNGADNADGAITCGAATLTGLATMTAATGTVNIFVGNTGDSVGRFNATSDGKLTFGPGSGTAVDTMLKRDSAGTLRIRNGSDASDANLIVNNITINGTQTNANQTAKTVYGVSGQSAAAPAFTTGLLQFGGDGSGGALTLSGSDAAITQQNGTTIQINDGATYTPKHGTILNATSTITIGQGASGILSCNGLGWAGGITSANNVTATPGAGPGGGPSEMISAGKQGGGGGGWAAGGATFNGQVGAAWPGGPDYVGSGGAAGQQSSSAVAGGNGGAGGGCLQLRAVGNIVVSAGGSATATGSAGSNGGAGSANPSAAGGSGGGGGGFVAYSQTGTVTATGNITCTGGAGGNGINGTVGGAAGSGGGGGLCLRMSPTAPAGVGTINVNGGAAGTAGTGGSPYAGSPGTNATAIAITGTPNYPLIVLHEKWLGPMEQIAMAHGEREYRMSARENASMIASLEGVQKGLDNIAFESLENRLLADGSFFESPYADFTIDNFVAGTGEATGLYCLGDYVEVDANAA